MFYFGKKVKHILVNEASLAIVVKKVNIWVDVLSDMMVDISIIKMLKAIIDIIFFGFDNNFIALITGFNDNILMFT